MKAFEPVRVAHCQHCGFPMRQYNPDSVLLMCESCGTRTGEGEKPPQYKLEPPFNPLFQLHAFFDMGGITWQVIGCQTYAGYSEEWDSEDEVWEKTPWRYHTWWVINEARQLAWVVQDKSGYQWSQKTKITGSVPEGDIHYEVGQWCLVSAVGEFSYRPSENERVISYEKDHYSLEILLDEKGNKKEIEAFETTHIEPNELLEAFGKHSSIQSIQRVKLASKAAIAAAFFLVVGFIVLHSFEKTLLSIPTTDITQRSLKVPMQLGSFQLADQGLIKLKVTGNIPTVDGSLDANFIINDSDNNTVSEVPISLWRESGRDSDGAWTESQSQYAFKVVLPGKDRYQVFLATQKLTNWSTINLRGEISKNVLSLLPVVIGAICAILLSLFLSNMRRRVIRRETGIY